MPRKYLALAVGILLCCGGSVQAQFVPALPGNGPPKVQYFHRYDATGETLQLEDVHEIIVKVPISERDHATGREHITYQSESRQIIERRAYRTAELRTISLRGDELKLAEVLGKLKTDDPVIVLAKGQKLPAGYAKILREDVAILQILTSPSGSVLQSPGYPPSLGDLASPPAPPVPVQSVPAVRDRF
jgi:hypothetical protein